MPEQVPELTDIEIAEEARRLLDQKNAEVAKLKKELAISKLHREAPADAESREEPWTPGVLIDPKGMSQLDLAKHFVKIQKYYNDCGKPERSPLGKQGVEVAEFFSQCIEESEDDPELFISAYQRNLGRDSQEALMAYNKIMKGG